MREMIIPLYGVFSFVVGLLMGVMAGRRLERQVVIKMAQEIRSRRKP